MIFLIMERVVLAIVVFAGFNPTYKGLFESISQRLITVMS